MKITKIEILKIMMDREKYPAIRAYPSVCRIYTDEGIYGDGEAAISYGIGDAAAFGMIKTLAPLLIGMDPLNTDVIWEKLYKTTFWAQNGGPVVFAGISALDLALWDIKGKALGQPVYQLLGGKHRDDLRVYASQLQFGWCGGEIHNGTPEEYAASCRQAVAEGFDAVKIDFFTFDEEGHKVPQYERTGLLRPRWLDMIEQRIAAVREAIGPKVDIIIECHAYCDAQGAVQIAKRAEKYNIFCLEEPCTSTPQLVKYVADNTSIPIAAGERIYTRWGYAPYFQQNAIQMIQPDLGTCGGITEARKIADLAHTYDVGVQAHGCSTPISKVAALHLEASLPNFVIHEHHMVSTTPYIRELCIHDYQPKNGRYEVPDLPGLGNEFSDFVFRHCEKVVVDKSGSVQQ